MKFKPFGNKYSFDKGMLIKAYPTFMQQPIANWLFKVLERSNMIYDSNNYLNRGEYYLDHSFHDELQVKFREVFPREWSNALIFILSDSGRLSNFLALCLQNFVDSFAADDLENILSEGGSAYEVIKTNKNAGIYDVGAYELTQRVSIVIKNLSQKALEDNVILDEAWKYCYSINPDYEKVVSRCCDFLEGFLAKKYFPKDPKPQLKKFVHAFENDPLALDYKGDAIVQPKSMLTSLLKEASNIRGQHVAGQGRKPTKQEAEFVLHTTIFIWNLHQK